MAKKKTKTIPQVSSQPASTRDGDSLARLIVAGDNHAARRVARARLASPSSDEERRAAEDILQRTGVDRGALLVGVVGVTMVSGIVALLFAG